MPLMRRKLCISIHAPTRGATSIFILLLTTQLFQSTLLQEERLNEVCIRLQDVYFNPRSYKRSDILLTCGQAELWRNFNPRSYKRSDEQGLLLRLPISISIHAPTRGATLCQRLLFHKETISIHAPTRGAT